MDITFDLAAQRVIDRTLNVGESLLWRGRPRRGLLLHSSDVYIIPFSLLWCVIVAQSIIDRISHEQPTIYWLWDLPFILMGIYLIAGRFLIDAWNRANTIYAVTNQRIIIISGVFSKSIHSLPLCTLTSIVLKERKDHSGTILFGHAQERKPAAIQWRWLGESFTAIFDLIPDARSVQDRILEAQRGNI